MLIHKYTDCLLRDCCGVGKERCMECGWLSIGNVFTGQERVDLGDL